VGTKKHAFTLIELLVVIAAVGILISLIFPLVSKGIEAGKRVSCAANLRSLSQAHYAEFGENGPEFISSRTVIGRFPPEQSSLVVQGHITTNVFLCPMDKGVRNPNAPGGGPISPPWFSYTRNGANMHPDRSVPVDVVRNPADAMLMMEEWELAPMNDAYVLPNQWDLLTARHNGRGGMSFCDGHVEYINANTFNTSSGSWRLLNYFNPP